MRSKLHHLTINQSNLNYVGSVTIDEDLLDSAGLIEGEKVQIMNVNNGERLETYIIVGERGSGEVCMNGPAARRCSPGDIIIVVAYGILSLEKVETFTPTVVFADTDTNKLK